MTDEVKGYICAVIATAVITLGIAACIFRIAGCAEHNGNTRLPSLEAQR